MSTAEQIIAEHLPDNRDIERRVGNCSCTCGWEGWGDTDAEKTAVFAAHVVAALTNAGKRIVDQADSNFEYGVERDVITGGRRVAETFNRSGAEDLAERWRNNPVVVQRRVFYGEWEPAAARVAEGGEHGE